MPHIPSYPLMHSLEVGFFIVIYSCTSNIKLKVCDIWHKLLYHSSAKSRNTLDTLVDMRFFSYICLFLISNNSNWAVGCHDCIARVVSEHMYRIMIMYVHMFTSKIVISINARKKHLWLIYVEYLKLHITGEGLLEICVILNGLLPEKLESLEM